MWTGVGKLSFLCCFNPICSTMRLQPAQSNPLPRRQEDKRKERLCSLQHQRQ